MIKSDGNKKRTYTSFGLKTTKRPLSKIVVVCRCIKSRIKKGRNRRCENTLIVIYITGAIKPSFYYRSTSSAWKDWSLLGRREWELEGTVCGLLPTAIVGCFPIIKVKVKVENLKNTLAHYEQRNMESIFSTTHSGISHSLSIFQKETASVCVDWFLLA
jgi:hypothetical protein